MLTRILILLLFLPFAAFSQEEAMDADSLPMPDYSGIRVYKNLSAALNQKDSVIRLDLSRQKLKELPESILSLPNLRELSVAHNNLKELPAWIGKMEQLEIFDASNNKLSGLPSTIGNMRSLGILRLNRNLIENLPPDMGELKKLQILEMWDNELVAVPYEMRNLSHLRVFELRGILFSDEEQRQIHDLLPETHIYFSPGCNCPK